MPIKSNPRMSAPMRQDKGRSSPCEIQCISQMGAVAAINVAPAQEIMLNLILRGSRIPLPILFPLLVEDTLLDATSLCTESTKSGQHKHIRLKPNNLLVTNGTSKAILFLMRYAFWPDVRCRALIVWDSSPSPETTCRALVSPPDAQPRSSADCCASTAVPLTLSPPLQNRGSGQDK